MTSTSIMLLRFMALGISSAAFWNRRNTTGWDNSILFKSLRHLTEKFRCFVISDSSVFLYLLYMISLGAVSRFLLLYQVASRFVYHVK